MAVRQCEVCEDLMQEGYAIETDIGAIEYYCNEFCLRMFFTFDNVEELKENKSIVEIEYHEWQPHEMDAEDFSLLLNKLQSEPTAHEIADILDILNRENEQHYAPEGIVNRFITFLNSQD